MTAFDGAHQDLFRGAILESGSPSDTLPTPPPTWPVYQEAWNAVIAGIGYVKLEGDREKIADFDLQV
jgi:hypothetical protein